MERDPDRTSTTYELDDDAVPSRAVYAAVSTADGRAPLDLPPLAWSVDPSGLDALLSGEGSSEIRFEYCGWLVTATPNAIRVESAVDDYRDVAGEAPDAVDDQQESGCEAPGVDDDQTETGDEVSGTGDE